MSNLMTSTVRKSSQGHATNAERYTRQVERARADLAYAQGVLALQIEQGQETQAAYTRTTIAKLERKLAKIEAL